jgi:S-adenosylmethionine synthetase
VSKVDRSGAYYARYVAKAVVRANLADRCEVQLGYVIGISNPVSIHVNTFNTGVIKDERIQELVTQVFNFRPHHIRQELELDNIRYQDLAKYGHCGREDLNVLWESVEVKANELKELYGKTKRASQVL